MEQQLPRCAARRKRVGARALLPTRLAGRFLVLLVRRCEGPPLRDPLPNLYRTPVQPQRIPHCPDAHPVNPYFFTSCLGSRGLRPISAHLIFAVHFSQSKRLDSWDRRCRGGSAMYGSGCRTAGTGATTGPRVTGARGSEGTAPNGCCGAGPGSAIRGTSVPHAATRTPLETGSASTGSALPGRSRRESILRRERSDSITGRGRRGRRSNLGRFAGPGPLRFGRPRPAQTGAIRPRPGSARSDRQPRSRRRVPRARARAQSRIRASRPSGVRSGARRWASRLREASERRNTSGW